MFSASPHWVCFGKLTVDPAEHHDAGRCRAAADQKASKLEHLQWCIRARYAHDSGLATVEGDPGTPAW